MATMIGRREFYVLIERDEDGLYVGEVPQLPACYAQGRTIDELLANMREVIALALDDEGAATLTPPNEFVGIQRISL